MEKSATRKFHGDASASAPTIGGFHLAPYKEDYVRETVTAIKDMNIDYVIPLHCTGEPFYEMTKAETPNKLLRSYTGTRFVFGA